MDSSSSDVTVRVPAEDFDRVSTILEVHQPIDLDERAAQYGATSTTTTATAMPERDIASSATSTDATVQLAEETLAVGKRAVSGGTTRIRRYVVETPVQLTARQRELLREFEAISEQDNARHNPRAKSWLDKVKEFFEG